MKWKGRRQSENVEDAPADSESKYYEEMTKRLPPMESPEEIQAYKKQVEQERLKHRSRLPEQPFAQRSDLDKFYEAKYSPTGFLPNKAPTPTPRPKQVNDKGYQFRKGGAVR